MTKYIKRSELIERGLYVVESKNFEDGEAMWINGSFIGHRKLDVVEFIDFEFHIDNKKPKGTVKPLKFIRIIETENG